MKTKQLLEIIFKSIGIFIVIPQVIYLPLNMYQAMVATNSLFLSDFSSSQTGILFFIVMLLYLVFLYYILIKTDIVVGWIYKEKEDEPVLNLKWHSKEVIYIAIVLSCLYSLFNITPSYLVNAVKALDFSNTEEPLFNSMFNQANYFYQDTAQIIASILILLNARRITAWVTAYKKKQLKADSSV